MTEFFSDWLGDIDAEFAMDEYLALFDIDDVGDDPDDETLIEKKFNRRKLTNRARRIARERAGLLIAELAEEKRKTVQRLINRAMKNGWSRAKLAGKIASYVGLTQRQQNAVENFRLKLIRDGVPKGEARKRYHAKVRAERASRARLIADNEVFAVRQQAKRERWEEKLQQGKLSPKWKRQWVTAEDERTCPICAPMHGRTATIGGTYAATGGIMLGPPVHPRCRCTEKLILEN